MIIARPNAKCHQISDFDTYCTCLIQIRALWFSQDIFIVCLEKVDTHFHSALHQLFYTEKLQDIFKFSSVQTLVWKLDTIFSLRLVKYTSTFPRLTTIYKDMQLVMYIRGRSLMTSLVFSGISTPPLPHVIPCHDFDYPPL